MGNDGQKTEQVFFAAQAQYSQGLTVDWATMAQDSGFADQAHLNRWTKRNQWLCAGDFAQRFVADESFLVISPVDLIQTAYSRSNVYL